MLLCGSFGSAQNGADTQPAPNFSSVATCSRIRLCQSGLWRDIILPLLKPCYFAWAPLPHNPFKLDATTQFQENKIKNPPLDIKQNNTTSNDRSTSFNQKTTRPNGLVPGRNLSFFFLLSLGRKFHWKPCEFLNKLLH